MRRGKLLRGFKKAYIKQQGWQEPIIPQIHGAVNTVLVLLKNLIKSAQAT